MNNLTDKLADRSAIIGIIGLGYVGLPLALRYAECGYQVIGFDTDKEKVHAIKNGISCISHVSSDAVAVAINNGFECVADFSRVSSADALIICVPTPLNEYRDPDLTFVINTVESILPYLHSGQIISLESTTYPGTTEEELQTRIESAGFEIGKDIFLVYSPEREDPANKRFITRTIPKVCGGITDACLAIGLALYNEIIDEVVPVSNTKTAEMTKLLENIHRAVNIGLVNEMKMVTDKMGIDIYEVIKAASTKPFGFVPYYPGPGLGGHCIPIDPFYLTWKARKYGVHTKFIELAGEVNNVMPDWVVDKIVFALNKQKKSVNGSRLLILGVAYKKNIGDMRESPAIHIMDKLMNLDAYVDYSDPYVQNISGIKKHPFEKNSVSLSVKTLSVYDLVILVTNHDCFDYKMIGDNANQIVDTRGVFSNTRADLISA